MKKWTLIETVEKGTLKYRVYKYDGFLTKFPNKNFDLQKELEIFSKRIKPVYERISDISNGFEYVIVSDAHTHIERLVFPAGKFRDKETEREFIAHLSTRCISGKYTFRIHGGDSNSVYPDGVYLRQLQMLNPIKESEK